MKNVQRTLALLLLAGLFLLSAVPASAWFGSKGKESGFLYSDMEGRGACRAAMTLAEKGIYQGRQVAGQWFFEPEERVSRSEFLHMAMKAAEIEVYDDVALTGFADDAAIPAWAKGYASAAVREGILSGIATAEGVVFRGEEAISVEEAAAMLDRLLHVTDVALPEGGTGWADQAVANMEAVEVVAAGSFGTDGLREDLTREQAAEMLCAAIDVLEKEQPQHFSWLG